MQESITGRLLSAAEANRLRELPSLESQIESLVSASRGWFTTDEEHNAMYELDCKDGMRQANAKASQQRSGGSRSGKSSNPWTTVGGRGR